MAASASPRRKRATIMRTVVTISVCCLAVLSVVNGQDAGNGGGASIGGGSAAGSPGVTPMPLPPTTTPAPTTKAPTPTTSAPPPTTLAPTPTTAAPVPTTMAPEPEVTLEATPAPTEATPAPTVTPKPAKTKKNTTRTEVAADVDAAPVAAATPAPEPTTMLTSARSADASADALTPGATPRSGVSYGGKSDSSSDSSQANEATTKSGSDSTKTAIHFVVVAAGVLGVVAAIAMSVHFHQKRRALTYEDDDKYLDPAPKRPTTIDVHAPTTTTASAAGPSTTAAGGATLYDNFTTPQAATVHSWRQKNNTTLIAQAPVQASLPPPAPLQQSMEFNGDEDYLDTSMLGAEPTPVVAQTAATTAATGAAFAVRSAGENDVDGGEDLDGRATTSGNGGATYTTENFREPRDARVTVKHITRCRGQSEASVAEDDDNLSQYGNGLLSATFASDDHDDVGYANTQMFAFSDSGSEGGRASSRTSSQQSRGAAGASSDVSEFLKYYNGPVVAPPKKQVDVDVDVDGYDDDEEIIGRTTRTSSLLSEDVRASDFTVDHSSRLSTSSSIADFHDSMVDRPSELDAEEFEV